MEPRNKGSQRQKSNAAVIEPKEEEENGKKILDEASDQVKKLEEKYRKQNHRLITHSTGHDRKSVPSDKIGLKLFLLARKKTKLAQRNDEAHTIGASYFPNNCPIFSEWQ